MKKLLIAAILLLASISVGIGYSAWLVNTTNHASCEEELTPEIGGFNLEK